MKEGRTDCELVLNCFQEGRAKAADTKHLPRATINKVSKGTKKKSLDGLTEDLQEYSKACRGMGVSSDHPKQTGYL